MDFEKFIENEEKALEVLKTKKEACQNEIQGLRESVEKIKNTPLIKLDDVPFFDKKLYIQAISDEKKRKGRMELRGETYTVSPQNIDILALPQKIKEIEERNKEIENKNITVKCSNITNENNRKELNAKFKKQQVLLSEINLLVKEAEKNIRYAKYAIEHKVELKDERELIHACNIHRNDFLAQQAYSSKYQGYSNCSKNDYECNEEIDYEEDYTSASCECGRATWILTRVPDPDSFDISTTDVEGECEGLAYFSPCVEESD